MSNEIMILHHVPMKQFDLLILYKMSEVLPVIIHYTIQQYTLLQLNINVQSKLHYRTLNAAFYAPRLEHTIYLVI